MRLRKELASTTNPTVANRIIRRCFDWCESCGRRRKHYATHGARKARKRWNRGRLSQIAKGAGLAKVDIW
jgi:hypothetical protein